MTIRSLQLIAILCTALAGCGGLKSASDDGLAFSEIKLDGRVPFVPAVYGDARFTVTSVEVVVPATLRVSEENKFHPNTDIVWRGEAPGDRYAQVKSIVEDGLSSGAAGLKTGPKAVLTVQVERFHAITEKARYVVEGVHDIVFVLTLRDAKTDAILEGPRRVEVDIKATGGEAAIAEDIAGRTQRVVIVEGLAEAIRRELSGPLSLVPPKKRGIFAGFN